MCVKTLCNNFIPSISQYGTIIQFHLQLPDSDQCCGLAFPIAETVYMYMHKSSILHAALHMYM